VNSRLFDTGVKRFYGYWTSFDDLAMYNCQLAGVERKIEIKDKKVDAIKFEEVKDINKIVIPNERTVTFYAKDEKQRHGRAGHEDHQGMAKEREHAVPREFCPVQ
jgi:hypothetical protein